MVISSLCLSSLFTALWLWFFLFHWLQFLLPISPFLEWQERYKRNLIQGNRIWHVHGIGSLLLKLSVASSKKAISKCLPPLSCHVIAQGGQSPLGTAHEGTIKCLIPPCVFVHALPDSHWICSHYLCMYSWMSLFWSMSLKINCISPLLFFST